MSEVHEPCRVRRAAIFDDRDVVRHPLVQRIVKAYERHTDMTGAGRQLSLRLSDGSDAGATPEEPRVDLDSGTDVPIQ